MNLKTFSAIIIGILVIGLGAFFMNKKPQQSQATTTEEAPVVDKKKLTIVAFGDSLTAGYGGPLEDSYPAQLEKKLTDEGISVQIINMGVSGETTAGARERVQFILDQRPDIVLLGLGANDMLRMLPTQETRTNLDYIIQMLTKDGTNVVLLGMRSFPTNGKAYTEAFDAIFPDLAKKHSLPFVPFFLDDVALNSTLNIQDGIHPNRTGYEKIINNNILPILLPYVKKNF
jgi:acyl-CoA thioesterase-1